MEAENLSRAEAPVNNERSVDYEKGMTVRIPRSLKEGQINPDIEEWEVLSVGTDQAMVNRPNSYDSKRISLEILNLYNGPMAEGSVVKTIRSDGSIDDGWTIKQIVETEEGTKAIITKKMADPKGVVNEYQKVVLINDLVAINQ